MFLVKLDQNDVGLDIKPVWGLLEDIAGGEKDFANSVSVSCAKVNLEIPISKYFVVLLPGISQILLWEGHLFIPGGPVVVARRASLHYFH